jgi:hypothetical protein
MDDRRSQARQLSCIPAYIESDQETTHLALIHDVSTDGALLFTRTKPEIDDPVHLSLYLLPENSIPRPVSGRVVRVEKRARDRADVWQWEVGVKFDTPIAEYSEEIAELTRRQRAVGVIKDQD